MGGCASSLGPWVDSQPLASDYCATDRERRRQTHRTFLIINLYAAAIGAVMISLYTLAQLV